MGLFLGVMGLVLFLRKEAAETYRYRLDNDPLYDKLAQSGLFLPGAFDDDLDNREHSLVSSLHMSGLFLPGAFDDDLDNQEHSLVSSLLNHKKLYP
ncbi:hypothetical protein T484DRAFT_1826687 [Baffinella frigidus]|nr:hypothetical protein T484DRAFT_1826687 [Cryptophyta sp. CCMP2293]